MTEAAFVDRLLAALRERGGWWVKVHQTAYGRAGTPDILGCYRGRFVAFEAKAPGAYRDPAQGLSPAQRNALAAIGEAGGGAWVVDDVAVAVALLLTLDPT